MNSKALVYAVDGSVECLLQLVSSIKSVRRCQTEKLDAYILTDTPRPWMYDLYGAKVVDISKLASTHGLDKTDITWRSNPVPPMLLARLLIPLVDELKGYDQVLYLDTDTEVWSPEFFNIFDMDSNCEAIAVKDSITHMSAAKRLAKVRANGKPGWKDPPGIYNRWDDIINGNGKYANSGVIVFNMDKLREGYEERFKYIMDRIRELKPYYSDQDTLNVYYKVFVVDDRRYDGWSRYEKGAFLRHYVGGDRRRFREYPKICDHRPNELLDACEKNDELGVLSGVVDHVYVLADDGAPENFSNLSAWMLANGVKKYTKIATKDTGTYSGLLDAVPADHGIKPEHMENWVGHYKAIVDGIKSGHGKIAVFEDTFSPNGLESALQELPCDFDIAICDRPGEFSRSSMFKAGSSKGYIISTKCMVDIRRLFESLWYSDTHDRKLRYMHKWLTQSVMVRERAFVRT